MLCLPTQVFRSVFSVWDFEKQITVFYLLRNVFDTSYHFISYD